MSSLIESLAFALPVGAQAMIDLVRCAIPLMVFGAIFWGMLTDFDYNTRDD